MALDPFLEAYIQKKAGEPRLSELDVESARASKSGSRLQLWSGSSESVTEDIEIPMAWGACRGRLYRPKTKASLPLVVFLHGGGFVVCSIETHDGLARGICGGAGVAVLSLDYRLAPEHPYPAGIDDTVAAVRWSTMNAHKLGVDPERLILCGDSAGGNLAVAAALRLAGNKDSPPLAGQALCYPVLDAPSAGHASYEEFAQGYGLTRAEMEWFWSHYTAGNPQAKEAMPLRATDLRRCPPTFLITAECDVLRDEGEAFASRLFKAGVHVTGQRYNGMNHNFLAFAESLPQAGKAMEDLCRWLRAVGSTGQLAQ